MSKSTSLLTSKEAKEEAEKRYLKHGIAELERLLAHERTGSLTFEMDLLRAHGSAERSAELGE
jgi:hypothetical protein